MLETGHCARGLAKGDAMGVTFGARCLDCGEDAPEVGDFGYIGYPSLSEEKGRRYVPNFGFLYRGLVALGMRTRAVEELRSFLLEHEGHQMEMSCEGEPMFGEDDDDDYEDEEEDGEEEDEDDYDDDEDDDEEDEEDQDEYLSRPSGAESHVDTKVFITAYYEVSCERCGKSLRSKFDDQIARFEARALTKSEVRGALRHLTVDESFERGSEPFSPDDFEGICDFLAQHAAHGPKVGLVPKA
jgi:hypothetical protein